MWQQILISLIFSAISYLLSPKAKPQAPTAAKLGDFDIPRASEGDEIGKVYGTVWIAAPQVAWYGDFKSTPIKSKGGKK